MDLDAIAGNVGALRALLPARTAFMAVVKADAYGHGSVPVARAALAAGATWLGVVTPEEALELRAAGLEAPVLIMGPTPAHWLPRVADAGCAIMVADQAMLDAVQGLPGSRRPRVHLKVDTGMTRMGTTLETLPALLEAVDPSRVVVEGLFTHLACADVPQSPVTGQQLRAFAEAMRAVRARFPAVLCHAAASAGVIGHPDAAFDMVRVGIALYGVPPAPHLAAPGLRPVMTLSSRVVRTRRVGAGVPVSYGATYRTPGPTVIATVPVGYADGYPRTLSNTGVMLIRGERFLVAGRVCMDYTMLDVGDAPVREGDEVTVFGPGLPADEVARTAGTIAHELFCRVGRRVPRLYLKGGTPVEIAGP